MVGLEGTGEPVLLHSGSEDQAFVAEQQRVRSCRCFEEVLRLTLSNAMMPGTSLSTQVPILVVSALNPVKLEAPGSL